VKTGTITAYFEDKGFGYIQEANTPRLVSWWFHIQSCLCPPIKGLKVQFNIGEGKKGPMAVDVSSADTAVNGVRS
jgi:cold shock CspA family protein